MAPQKPLSPQQWIYKLAVLFVLCYFGVIKLKYLMTDNLWPDEALYAWQGEKIFENPLFIFSKNFSYPSLLPVLLSFGNFLPHPLFFYKLFSLFTSLLGLAAIYQLGALISNPALGLYAAILLGANTIYYTVTTKILLDGPLTVCVIYIALFLIKTHVSPSWKNAVFLTVFCSAAVLIKIPIAMLLLPWLAVTALSFTLDKRRHGLPRIVTPLIVTLLVSVFYLLRNILIAGQPFSSLTALSGKYFIHKDPFCYLRNYLILLPNTFLPLVLLGLAGLMKKEREIVVVLLSWLIWLGLISFIPEKVPRYFLPVIPCFILLSGIGIETAVKLLIPAKRQAQNIVTACWVLLIGATLTITPPEKRIPSIKEQLHAFTGLREAGAWLAENVKKDTVVISSSIRSLRYFSGIEFKEDSGHLVPLPATRTGWEHLLAENPGPLILEYSRWQRVPYLDPDGPSGTGMADVLVQEGFTKELTIIKPWFFTDGYSADMPVVWLFSRPASRH
ncbi:MAG: glycosyltransferase family 39 protein [Candidatus Omnitrophota bacterium]|jgi:4-amino-4-deoxy-L-arabinose transferase-like glycosyltransferase